MPQDDASQLPPPPCPCELDLVADPLSLQALNALELGAVMSLVWIAWHQRPPCTLPADETFLARWARCTEDQWTAARPAVLRALLAQESAGDGRLHLAAARAAYDRLSAKAARRSAAGRIAINQRWHGPPDDDPGPGRPIRLVHDSNTPGIPQRPCAPILSASSAPAPLRPSGQIEIRSARAPQDSAVDVGAGARALAEELRRKADRAEVIHTLTRASFAWADQDRRVVPRSLAEDLADAPAATPMLAAYAVQRIDEDGRARAARGERMNPLGMLVAAFGAQRNRPKKPWDVPLYFAKAWEERQADKAKVQEVQQRLDAVRRQRLVGEAAGARTVRASTP